MKIVLYPLINGFCDRCRWTLWQIVWLIGLYVDAANLPVCQAVFAKIIKTSVRVTHFERPEHYNEVCKSPLRSHLTMMTLHSKLGCLAFLAIVLVNEAFAGEPPDKDPVPLGDFFFLDAGDRDFAPLQVLSTNMHVAVKYIENNRYDLNLRVDYEVRNDSELEEIEIAAIGHNIMLHLDEERVLSTKQPNAVSAAPHRILEFICNSEFNRIRRLSIQPFKLSIRPGAIRRLRFEYYCPSHEFFESYFGHGSITYLLNPQFGGSIRTTYSLDERLSSTKYLRHLSYDAKDWKDQPFTANFARNQKQFDTDYISLYFNDPKPPYEPPLPLGVERAEYSFAPFITRWNIFVFTALVGMVLIFATRWYLAFRRRTVRTSETNCV